MVNQVVTLKPKGQGHKKKQGYKNTNMTKIMNIKYPLIICLWGRYGQSSSQI